MHNNILYQELWCANLFYHTLVHYDDAIDHRQRLFLIVRDHHRGDTQAPL